MNKIRLLIICTLIFSISTLAFADSGQDRFYFTPKIYINGKELNMQNVLTCPYIKNLPYYNVSKDVYAPLKVICESMGDRVEFDSVSKTPIIIKGDKSIVVENYEIDNGTVLVPLDFLDKNLDLDIEAKYNSHTGIIDIKGDFTYSPNKPKLSIRNINEFGNAFKGKINKEHDQYSSYETRVIIAKRSDLPINLGNVIVYDVYPNSKSFTFPLIFQEKPHGIYKNMTFKAGETFSFKSKAPLDYAWSSYNVYLSCKDGLNRGRNIINYGTKNGDTSPIKKDKNGIITGIYNVTALSDQPDNGKGNDYKKFTLNEVNYFVIIGQDAILAIPKAEVIEK